MDLVNLYIGQPTRNVLSQVHLLGPITMWIKMALLDPK